MFEANSLSAFYAGIQVLHNVNLTAKRGQIVGLVGANAAGKSSLMYSFAGIRTRCTGQIMLDDEDISDCPGNERVEKGLVLVPERRRLFPYMTVRENLEIGAYNKNVRPMRKESLEKVFDLLPRLAERQNQMAGSMSGGEQQMVAIGRALMSRPKVLLLDEPTEGLAPVYVTRVYELISSLKLFDLAIVIVEQNIQHVLRASDKSYVLEQGKIVMEGTGQSLLENEKLKEAYLGL